MVAFHSHTVCQRTVTVWTRSCALGLCVILLNVKAIYRHWNLALNIDTVPIYMQHGLQAVS